MPGLGYRSMVGRVPGIHKALSCQHLGKKKKKTTERQNSVCVVLGGIENEVPGNSATDRERRHSPAYQQIYKDDEPCSPARVRTTVTPGGQQVALWLQRETGLQRERGPELDSNMGQLDLSGG